jgi:hypothetical protein
MRRICAALALALLVTGCEEDKKVRTGPSLQQQQRKQLQSELDKVQSQINRNVQNAINTGQNALQSARPRMGR